MCIILLSFLLLSYTRWTYSISGTGVIVEFTVQTPSKPGKYEFTLELSQGSDGWFGDAGDLPWVKPVEVV